MPRSVVQRKRCSNNTRCSSTVTGCVGTNGVFEDKALGLRIGRGLVVPRDLHHHKHGARIKKVVMASVGAYLIQTEEGIIREIRCRYLHTEITPSRAPLNKTRSVVHDSPSAVIASW